MPSNSPDAAAPLLRKVHHVRKQLLTLSAQLLGTEKEVALLLERAVKVS